MKSRLLCVIFVETFCTYKIKPKNTCFTHKCTKAWKEGGYGGNK